MATVAAAQAAKATAAKFKCRSGKTQIEQSERDNFRLDLQRRYDQSAASLGEQFGRQPVEVAVEEVVDIELGVEESRSLIGTATCQRGVQDDDDQNGNENEAEREPACKTIVHSEELATSSIKCAADRHRIASYANGQRRTSPISELSNRSPTTNSKTIDRDKNPKQQADMTTESFVPTDQQHQFSNSAEQQDIIEGQQFIANAHCEPAQAARPIGLNSGSPRFLLSAPEDDNAGRQDRERPGDAEYAMISLCDNNNNNNNNNNMADGGTQAVEKYSVISSSSMMSLSDEHHYGQGHDCGGGSAGVGRLATSCSTNAINQSRSAGTKGMIGRLVGKKTARIRELVLQNLGRADRTTDELFDLYEANFYKQQQQVLLLTKEFKLYTNALKSYHEASRSLSKCIQQSTCGYQLARHDLICDNLSQLDSLNEDLMEKVQDKVIKSLGDYLTRFHEIKDKINKRHRKLVDYDSSRRLYELMYARVSKKRSLNAQQQQSPQHNYQSILRGIKFLSQQQQQQQRPSAGGQHAHQESAIANQLVDEARLLKLREQFNYSKLMYESINSELHEELPIVYESKMKSLLNALQNYYDIRAHHHSNAAKLVAKVSDVMIVGSSARGGGDKTLSMYAETGANRETSTAIRGTSSSEEGSGSSGVSLSGSASRSSGSSLASPDCDDQHRRQPEQHDDCQNESHNQDESKNGNVPAGSGASDRQFVEVSLESAGDRDQQKAPVDATGDVAVVCEQDSAGSDSAEESFHYEKSVQDARDAGDAPEASSNDDDVEVTENSIRGEVEPVIAHDAVRKSIECSATETGDGPMKDVRLDSSDAEQRDYLYRVRTNYKYLAEDVDELCFEANEIIQVIDFDENHEPEDGWLLGIREVNNQRGLFPANFTQPI